MKGHVWLHRKFQNSPGVWMVKLPGDIARPVGKEDEQGVSEEILIARAEYSRARSEYVNIICDMLREKYDNAVITVHDKYVTAEICGKVVAKKALRV